MFLRGTSYSAAAEARKSHTARRAALMAALALFLGGCSSVGLGDYARGPQASNQAGAGLMKASLTVADTVDPSDWEAVRRRIARIPRDDIGRYDWSNPDTRSTGTMTVLAVGTAGSSATCRPFATTLSDSRGIRRYRGEACRRADGRWQLFGIRADDAKLM
ncbi:MAG: RT0821/Lpp0805 family surface protein [Alphaproteobacteria bacterium]